MSPLNPKLSNFYLTESTRRSVSLEGFTSSLALICCRVKKLHNVVTNLETSFASVTNVNVDMLQPSPISTGVQISEQRQKSDFDVPTADLKCQE